MVTLITAIAGLVTAVAGLVTAVRGHRVSTRNISHVVGRVESLEKSGGSNEVTKP